MIKLKHNEIRIETPHIFLLVLNSNLYQEVLSGVTGGVDALQHLQPFVTDFKLNGTRFSKKLR